MKWGAQAARGGVEVHGIPGDVHQRRLYYLFHLHDGGHIVALRLDLFNFSPDDWTKESESDFYDDSKWAHHCKGAKRVLSSQLISSSYSMARRSKADLFL